MPWKRLGQRQTQGEDTIPPEMREMLGEGGGEGWLRRTPDGIPDSPEGKGRDLGLSQPRSRNRP